MPISINTFRNQFLSSSNKWKSGAASPSRLDLFLNQASISLFNEKYLNAAKSNKLDDDLNPFLESVNLPVEIPEGVNYGIVERPVLYKYFWSMRAFFADTKQGTVSCACPSSENSEQCNASLNFPTDTPEIEEIKIVAEVNVDKVDSGRWASVLSHRFKYPSLKNPACTQFEGGFKVAPRDLNVITLDFYKMPEAAHFGYTVSASNNIVYSPSLSTDIEWPETVMDELLDRTMMIFSGGFLKDQEMYQYSKEQNASRV